MLETAIFEQGCWPRGYKARPILVAPEIAPPRNLFLRCPRELGLYDTTTTVI